MATRYSSHFAALVLPPVMNSKMHGYPCKGRFFCDVHRFGRDIEQREFTSSELIDLGTVRRQHQCHLVNCGPEYSVYSVLFIEGLWGGE